jgi:predicted acyltransferase
MRYQSIDFYRGLTIALMLVVNTPGTWNHVFPPLLHAEWHGCTPTDLVFPSFMFIIGVSMWFSLQKYGTTLNPASVLKILKRGGLLFLIGLFLAKFPFFLQDWDKIRIMGVMQRLGLGYALAALLALWLPNRVLAATAVALLLGYWGAMMQGGAGHGDPYSLDHNLARQIDLRLLSAAHLWKGKGIPFDPEGLFSTLPAIVTVLLGWWSGALMQRHQADKITAVRELLQWGCLLGALGMVWDIGFPINKYLWTSSYVLYAGGLSMILLAFSVWLLDLRQWRWGVPFFLVFGANSLVAYVLSSLLTKTMLNIKWMDGEKTVTAYAWIYRNIFAAIEPYKTGSLLFALFFMLVCWSVCWLMYRNKIFVKL